VHRLVDVKQPSTLDQLHYDKVVSNALSQNIFSSEEICGRLGMNFNTFENKFLLLKSGKIFSPPIEGFKLRQRYKHVISEADRVERAAISLKNGDINEFGNLMDESHQSCKDLYEISIEELDMLVKICRGNGALGSRLTGAGFGGCVVSLVPKAKVDEFKEGVISEYYKKYFAEKHPQIEIPFNDMKAFLFNSPATKGAGFIC
jgi:N-acetylgalactosamine kinase